jgi:hypothetical protein
MYRRYQSSFWHIFNQQLINEHDNTVQSIPSKQVTIRNCFFYNSDINVKISTCTLHKLNKNKTICNRKSTLAIRQASVDGSHHQRLPVDISRLGTQCARGPRLPNASHRRAPAAVHNSRPNIVVAASRPRCALRAERTQIYRERAENQDLQSEQVAGASLDRSNCCWRKISFQLVGYQLKMQQ